MANVVLKEDSLFLRFNALSQTGDGYVDNTTLGKEVNDIDFWGWRAGLRWLPTERLEVILTADDSESDQNGVYALNVLNGIPDDLFQSSSVTDIFNISETDGVRRGHAVCQRSTADSGGRHARPIGEPTSRLGAHCADDQVPQVDREVREAVHLCGERPRTEV